MTSRVVLKTIVFLLSFSLQSRGVLITDNSFATPETRAGHALCQFKHGALALFQSVYRRPNGVMIRLGWGSTDIR